MNEILGQLHLTSKESEILKRILNEDRYEKNKDFAMHLLAKYDGDQCPKTALEKWNEILVNLNSINPGVVSNATYGLLYLIGSPGFIKAFQSKNRFHSGVQVLIILQDKVQDQISKLEHMDPKYPLYGYLLAMRMILKTFSKDNLNDLQSFAAKMLAICAQIRILTSEILDDSSPEGTVYDGADMSLAQQILLCSWRSSKEVSLLMAQLINLMPINADSTSGLLLNDAQVEEIVAFFVTVLESSVHRGAFEQAFAGFSDVCSFLWRSKCKKWNRLAEELIQSTLEDVSSKVNKIYCISIK